MWYSTGVDKVEAIVKLILYTIRAGTSVDIVLTLIGSMFIPAQFIYYIPENQTYFRTIGSFVSA